MQGNPAGAYKCVLENNITKAPAEGSRAMKVNRQQSNRRLVRRKAQSGQAITMLRAGSTHAPGSAASLLGEASQRVAWGPEPLAAQQLDGRLAVCGEMHASQRRLGDGQCERRLPSLELLKLVT
jgi:hypothetical protein